MGVRRSARPPRRPVLARSARLADVNPGADTIEFAANYFANSPTIVLQQGQLTIASDVTVDGGDLGITIDANRESRVLHLQAGADVTLDGLALTGGRLTAEGGEALIDGGGILTNDGTSLTLLRTSVVGNATEVGNGGGIAAGGNLVLRDSAVTDNFAKFFAGGIYGGQAANPISLTNSTVADNQATSAGGVSSTGDVSFTDSTLTGNVARSFGVVSVEDGRLTFANSIMVGNFSGGDPDINGSLTESNGHNLFGTAVRGTIAGDLENIAAQSVFAATAPIAGTSVSGGVLADNGGPTETVALLDASTNPALGRGGAIASLTTDQRGEPRPAVNPDIGAFELEQSHATAVGTPGVKLLQGSSDSEALLGLSHDERLYGRGGDDLLDGGAGHDRLHAGKGGDVLIGGGPCRPVHPRCGRRTVSRASPTRSSTSRSARVTGSLLRASSTAISTSPATSRSSSSAATAFTDAGQMMEQVVDGHTVIRVNLDDDLRAELRIELHDAIDLHRADFVL